MIICSGIILQGIYMRTSLSLSYFSSNLYHVLIQPRGATVDERRREYILNILLSCLSLLATVSLVISGYDFVSRTVAYNSSSFIGTCIFTGVVYGLFWLSRRGFYRVSSYILIGLLCVTGLQLLLTYGFVLPQSSLTFIIAIVVSSVLISARLGLLITGALAITEIAVALAQLHHSLRPNLSWLRQSVSFGDSAGYAIVFIIIGVVTWLSNREIDRSLLRARQSEFDLAQERDSLEVKVQARTRELEESQHLRIVELQRFAEFGRLSANLLHEVASPLTAASLNLNQITQDDSYMIEQVQKNIQQIERYVISARKQIQRESSSDVMNVSSEIDQVISLVSPLAHSSAVKLNVQCPPSIELYGDAVKFSQLVANLVINAIDASRLKHSAKYVQINASIDGTQLTISVHDRGLGIKAADLTQIFEPFFSTKSAENRGLGIGLALVKQFVEEDFRGTIAVKSNQEHGTTFTVTMPLGTS